LKNIGNLDEVYNQLENLNTPEIKGKLKEKLMSNKDLAYLSKQLGTICKEVPVDEEVEKLAVKPYNTDELYKLFKKLNFNKYIEKLGLSIEQKDELDYKYEIINSNDFIKIKDEIINQKYFAYSLYTQQQIISFYINDKTYCLAYSKNEEYKIFKDIFENSEILKIGYKLKEDYIYLKKLGIESNNMMFDIEIAAYILNASKNKYEISEMAEEYLNIDATEFLKEDDKENVQLLLNLDGNVSKTQEQSKEDRNSKEAYLIYKIYLELKKKLQENQQYDLFNNIEMPLLEVLANMELVGMHIDKNALMEYAKEINNKVNESTKRIYDLAGCEFNINSPKQLRRNIV